VEAARREQNGREGADTPAQAKSTIPELKEFFVMDAEGALEVLGGLVPRLHELSDEERETYITAVHGMKSALANIGEKRLSGDALKLERAGERRDIGVMSEKTPVFMDALRSLIVKFKPAETEESKAEMSDEDKTYLREKLLIVKAACEKLDKNAAKAALAEVKEKTWPGHINAALMDVSTHILHSAFRDAAAAAEKTAKTF
jgi:hypothetical protein